MSKKNTNNVVLHLRNLAIVLSMGWLAPTTDHHRTIRGTVTRHRSLT